MASEAFARWAARTEATLLALLPDPAVEPSHLHAAMRHATLGGGKRMRPLLVYATGTALGAEGQLVASGGRVLVVVGTGDDIAAARRNAYDHIAQIDFADGFCRSDIAAKAI